jgi:lipid-A-disaccharide synthase
MKPLKIGIVVGESSGDILGAGLIRALRENCPDIQVRGIGGPLMIAQGCESFFPMERLSVMGLIEPLKRLPELLGIRRFLKKYFVENPPDVFIGIDSPDFVLNLEMFLKQRGIKTVHYVSPSVWAWRQSRIHKIKRAVDHLLTLFPFEQEVYRRHQVPVTFVGHPLADQFPLTCDTAAYREQLKLTQTGTYVALLPGSRESEVALLAPVFLQAAQLLADKIPDLMFLIPAANPERKQQLETLLRNIALPVTVFDGQSRVVMGASNGVLLASGTATLEALLLKKPMVVAYKMGFVSYGIISRLLKISHVALPNLLAGRALVPELIQKEVQPEQIAIAMERALQDETYIVSLQETYTRIHRQLQCQASQRAADTVLEVAGAARC